MPCKRHAGSVFSVPHQVADIFLVEEEIVSLVNRSTSRQEVDIYLDSWTSRVNQPIGSDYFEDVLQKGRVHLFPSNASHLKPPSSPPLLSFAKVR